MDFKLEEILGRFPLRVAVTDFCNLSCFFCTNEGMKPEMRNTTHSDIDSLKFIIETTVRHGLKSLSITGGEPTLHPEIHRLLEVITASGAKDLFFHTNGIELTPDLINGPLRLFSKIAISVHSTAFATWHKMTQGTEQQFDKLWNNLHFLGASRFGNRLEIKHIPIAGLNDSIDDLKNTLDFCAKYGAKFKFLLLEPVEASHLRLKVPLIDLFNKLEEIGCIPLQPSQLFRGQNRYLPINRYQYKEIAGVAIEIGCGKLEVCQACFDSNEIFIAPNLEIKPCHIDSTVIPLNEAIMTRNEGELLEAILLSRKLLHEEKSRAYRYWHQGLKRTDMQ